MLNNFFDTKKNRFHEIDKFLKSRQDKVEVKEYVSRLKTWRSIANLERSATIKI